MPTVLKKLTDYEHPYYCSDNKNQHYDTFQTWDDFEMEYGNADIDMNLVFRWDFRKHGTNHPYELRLFMIQQRKGIFKPIIVKGIIPDDLESIETYLHEHWKRLQLMWQPFN